VVETDENSISCEAIDMKVPGELYTSSSRRYDDLPDVDYPFHDRDILFTACGRICLAIERR
jgi:hypothetical protein